MLWIFLKQNFASAHWRSVASGPLIFFFSLFLASCSGGGNAPSDPSDGSASQVFAGAELITENPDGSWELSWTPIMGIPDISYLIYEAPEGKPFDFGSFSATSRASTYTTADLRLAGSTCYVVRFSQPGVAVDQNQNAICTGHKAFEFSGVEEISNLLDGTYVLRWKAPSFEGVRYRVASRGKTDKSFKPEGVTGRNFYVTRSIGAGEQVCFRVRYDVEGFPPDANERELCTRDGQGAAKFEGVSYVGAGAKGSLRVLWKPVDDPDLVGYRVYIGNDFKQLAKEVKERNAEGTLIEGLLHGVAYTVGVRMVDKYGREDVNTEVMSYELTNHKPEITSLRIESVKTGANNRPERLRCVAEYSDEDFWQTLTPRFAFFNKKRGAGVGTAERLQVKDLAPGVVEVDYDVTDNDLRLDEIICQLTVFDGFDDSQDQRSDGFVIPDTPPVATNLSLVAVENALTEVTLSPGPGNGYIDFDLDPAEDIEVANIKNAEVIRGFVCTQGTCTAQIRPTKDFFSQPATKEQVTLTYQVKSLDSVSAPGVVSVWVLPAPRAKGIVRLDGEQDEDYSTQIALNDGYTHALDLRADSISFKSIQNGTIIQGNKQFSQCASGSDCVASCPAGVCAFTIRPDAGFYGEMTFDYSVVVNNIRSNDAVARVTFNPKLRAKAYNGRSIQNVPFEIVFEEGKGFFGAQEGIRVTSVVAQVGTTSAPNGQLGSFVCSTTENVCRAMLTPKSTTFSGFFEFTFRVTGLDERRNQIIESNEQKGRIEFYPLPRATGVTVHAVENINQTVELLQTGDPTIPKVGYQHRSDLAAFVHVREVRNGRIQQLGASTLGEVPCISGVCNLTYIPDFDFHSFQGGTEDPATFLYYVRTVPQPPASGIDKDLITERGIVYLDSDEETAFIRVFPVPKTTGQGPIAFRVDDTQLLNIKLNNGFTHSKNIGARTVRFQTPAKGSLSANPLVCVSGECTTVFNPLGEVGLVEIGYGGGITIFDADYGGEITSVPRPNDVENKIKLDVRPVPIATGRSGVGSQFVTIEKSTSNLVLQRGLEAEKLGYAHFWQYPAKSINVTAQPHDVSGAAKGTLASFVCDQAGWVPGLSIPTDADCSATFSTVGGEYGLLTFQYKVSTEDDALGVLESKNAAVAEIDVRPRPVAKPWSQRIVQNSFAVPLLLKLNEAYSHPYGYPANSVVVTQAPADGTFVNPTCAASGVCTAMYTPAVDFFGERTFAFTVGVQDPKANAVFSEPGSTFTIDVYPRPVATGREVAIVQDTAVALTLAYSAPYDAAKEAKDQSGYFHHYFDPPRDDKPSRVIVTDVTNGSFSGTDPNSYFSCSQASGVCAANFQPTAGFHGVASFKYRVEIEGVLSNEATYTVQVRPRPVATGIGLVLLESDSDLFSVSRNAGYTHPEVENGRLLSVSGLVSPAFAGTMDSWQCADQTCTAAYHSGTYNATQEVTTFQYTVTVEDPYLGSVSSLPGTASLRVRPRPQATGLSLVAVEGAQREVAFTIGLPDSLLGLTYADSAYVSGVLSANSSFQQPKIQVQPGSSRNGSPSPGAELTCTAGKCLFSFTPSVSGGRSYYGPDAGFTYRALVHDSYLDRFVESLPAQVNIDYRPKPVIDNSLLGAAEKAVLQNSTDSEFTLSEAKRGYELPSGYSYSHAALSVSSIAPAGSSSTTNCDPNLLDGEICLRVTPAQDYYGLMTVTYSVSLFDAVLNDRISSEPGVLLIDVRPVPTTLAVTGVQGVEGVDKSIEFVHGVSWNYAYANSLTQDPVLNLTALTNVQEVSKACSATSKNCLASMRPAILHHGEASFGYSIAVYDPVLGRNVTSNTSTVGLDFYPLPVALPYLKETNTEFRSREESPANLALKMASSSTELCAGGSSVAEKTYISRRCDVPTVVEVQYQNDSFFTLNTDPPRFVCAPDTGQCAATATPLPVGTVMNGVTWQGFGKTSLRYRVRILPTGPTFTPEEQAALVSNWASVELEFTPIPRTRDKDLWSIEGAATVPYKINICPDMGIASCTENYTHGYNWPADSYNITPMADAATISLAEIPGANACSLTTDKSCTLMFRPINYASNQSDSSDRVRYRYTVNVAGDTSNESILSFNVYPRPRALGLGATSPLKAVQGKEFLVEVRPGEGFSHAAAAKPIELEITDFNMNEFSGLQPCAADAARVACIPCNASGECNINLRARNSSKVHADFYGQTYFMYRVSIASPSAAFPNILKPYLTSDPGQVMVDVIPKPVAQDFSFYVPEWPGPNLAVPLVLQAGRVGAGVVGRVEAFSVPDYTYPRTELSDLVLSAIGGTNWLQLLGTQGAPPKPYWKLVSRADSSTQIGVLKSQGCSEDRCAYVLDRMADAYGAADFGVRAELNGIADLISDNTATASINIRPLPRTPRNIGTLMVPEGNDALVTIGGVSNIGFSHPEGYAPVAVNIVSGSESNGLVITTDTAFDATQKTATVLFRPDALFAPVSSDRSQNKASFQYRASVLDPFLNIELQSASGSAGERHGLVDLEYRPRPRQQARTWYLPEGGSVQTSYAAGSGYTHSLSLLASKMLLDIPSAGWSYTGGDPVDGTIACTSGSCLTTVTPPSGFVGTQSATRSIWVFDGSLPVPEQQLRSKDTVTDTFVVRPRPQASSVVFKGIESEAQPWLFTSGSTFTHDPSQTALYIEVLGLDAATEGILETGVHGVSYDAVSGSYRIPCTAGVCLASYKNSGAFPNPGTFTYKVVVSDPPPSTLGTISSLEASGTVFVRRRPVAVAFSINSPQNRTGEVRKRSISIAASGFSDVYSPARALVHADLQVPVTTPVVVGKGASESAVTSFECPTQPTGCSGWVKSTGAAGTYQIPFTVKVFDPVLNQEIESLPSSPGMLTVTVRPFPEAVDRQAYVAERITGEFETSVQVQVKLNNGYSIDTSLPIESLELGSVTGSGTAGAPVCSGANASRDCSFTVTPQNAYVGSIGVPFRVVVIDPALTIDPLDPEGNLLRSGDAELRVEVRGRPRTSTQVVRFVRAESESVSDVDFALMGPLSGNPTPDYTDPHGRNASHVTIKSTVNLTLAGGSICGVPDATDSSSCFQKGTVPSDSYTGYSEARYSVSVFDPFLQENLESPEPFGRYEALVRPRPRLLVPPAGLKTAQATDITVQFNLGSGKEFDYIEFIDPAPGNQLTLHAHTPSGGHFITDSGSAVESINVPCTTMCQIKFRPHAWFSGDPDGTNPATFRYGVSVVDQEMGGLSLDSRPLFKQVDVAVFARPITSNSMGVVTVFQGTSKDILVPRGTTAGQDGALYEYKYQANSRASSLSLSGEIPSNQMGKLVVAGTPSQTGTFPCADSGTHICTVGFQASASESGLTSIEYNLSVDEPALAASLTSLRSSDLMLSRSSIAVDIYPRPTCAAKPMLTLVQGQGAIAVDLNRGDGLGYEHPRLDGAFEVSAFAGGLPSTLDGNQSVVKPCTAGLCSVSYQPVSSFYTTEALAESDGSSAGFFYRVRTGPEGGIDNAVDCQQKAIVKPKPQGKPPTDIWVVEGATLNIVLKGSDSDSAQQGYYHPYSTTNPKARATSIRILGASRGSVLSSSCNSSTGECSIEFQASSGTQASHFGLNAASITYAVTTWDVESAPVTLNLEVVPKPKVQSLSYSALSALRGIEGLPLAGVNIGLGHNGYILGVADYPQSHPTLVEVSLQSNVQSAPASCPGGQPCQIGPITPTSGHSFGVDGSAVLAFRVGYQPKPAVTVWSHPSPDPLTWAQMDLYFASRPTTTGLSFVSGLEGGPVSVSFDVGSGQGYTHPENREASAILPVSGSDQNAQTLGLSNCAVSGYTHRCLIDVTPSASFTTLAGEPNPPGEGSSHNHNGKAYGWVNFQYHVEVYDPILGAPVLSSSPSHAWVYFRPRPEPSSPAGVATWVEGEPFNSVIAPGVGQGYLYERSSERPLSTVLISQNNSGGSVSFGVCDLFGCPVTFTPPAGIWFGLKTFQYAPRVVDPDGVVVDSPSGVSGTFEVNFRARPRVRPLDDTHISGSTKTSLGNGYALETCLASGTQSSDTVQLSLSAGTFDPATYAATGNSTGYYHFEGRRPPVGSDLAVTVATAAADVPPGKGIAVSELQNASLTTGTTCDGTGNCLLELKPRCLSLGESSLQVTGKFKVADTEGLSAPAAAGLNITVVPRLAATGKIVGRMDPGMLITDEPGTVVVSKGDGYAHARNEDAASVEIYAVRGASTPVVGQSITCTSGNCEIPITPTYADRFVEIEYLVRDGSGFTSRSVGLLEVYAMSRPTASDFSLRVLERDLESEPTRSISIQAGSGFTHAAEPLVSVDVVSSSLEGSLGAFVCSNGICTAPYSPSAGFAVANPESNTNSFQFRVSVGGGQIWSSAVATATVDVYPRPRVYDSQIKWLEGVGNPLLSPEEAQMVSVRRGPSSPEYQVRLTDAEDFIPSIVISTVSGVSNWLTAMSCDASTGHCNGKLQANDFSSDPNTPAKILSYQIIMTEKSGSPPKAFASHPANVYVYIQPKPQARDVAFDIYEDEVVSLSFRDLNSGSGLSRTLAALLYPWSLSNAWVTKDGNRLPQSPVEILHNPFARDTTNGGSTTEISANFPSALPLTTTFGYFAVSDETGSGFYAYSDATNTGTATVTVKSVLATDDVSPPTGLQYGGSVVSVDVELVRGVNWYDRRDPAADVQGFEFDPFRGGSAGNVCNNKLSNDGDLAGSIGAFVHMGGGTWSADFTSAAGSSGVRCFFYRAYRLLSVDGEEKKLVSGWSEIRVRVESADRAAEVCSKTREGHLDLPLSDPDRGNTVLVVAGRNRDITAGRGTCATGGWYLDLDNDQADLATELQIVALPASGSIQLIAPGGGVTNCASASLANPCKVACSEGDCQLRFVPGATTVPADSRVLITGMQYKVVTRNIILNEEKESDPGIVTFELRNAPKPVLKAHSVTVQEDSGIGISLPNPDPDNPSAYFKYWSELGLRFDPDGYPWVADSAVVTECSGSSFRSSLPQVFSCASNSCFATVLVGYDSTQPVSCTWTATVNGATSDPASITATITPVDDAPNTYGQGNSIVVPGLTDPSTGNVIDSFFGSGNAPYFWSEVHRLSDFDTVLSCPDLEGTWMNASPHIISIVPGEEDIYIPAMNYSASSCRGLLSGYVDRDGHKAKEVLINSDPATQVGVDTVGPFTCDTTSGRCTGSFKPANDFVGLARFQYKVKTCSNPADDATCLTSPIWQSWRVRVHPTPTQVAPVVGTSAGVLSGITTQGSPLSFIYTHLSGSVTPVPAGRYTQKAFYEGHFDRFEASKYATSITTQDAVGVNATGTCDGSTGVCLLSVNPNPGFLGSASFNFRLSTGENYYADPPKSRVSSYRPGPYYFADRLKATSSLVPASISVNAVPIATGKVFNVAAGTSLPVSLSLGSGYSHSSNIKAKAITIRLPRDGSGNEIPQPGVLSTFAACNGSGVCTSTFTPDAGISTFPAVASYEYLVEATDGTLSPAWGTLTFNISSLVLQSKEVTDVSEGASHEVTFTQVLYSSYSPTGTSGAFAHPTDSDDNLTLEITGLDPATEGTLSAGSGAGVSESGGVYTVSCSAGVFPATCVFEFNPHASSFNGTATAQVVVKRNGVSSPAAALSIAYKARPTLLGTPLSVTALQAQPKTVTIAPRVSAEAEYGYQHRDNQPATLVHLIGVVDPSALQSVTAGSCSAGTCTLTIVPAADFVGSTSFSYNVTADGLTASANRTITVLVTAPPVLIGQNLKTNKDDTVEVSVSEGPTGYQTGSGTPAEWEASEIVVTGSHRGTGVDGSGTVVNTFPCTGGSCTVRFKPAVGYAGNDGYLTLAVRVNGVLSASALFSVRIDGAPVGADRSVSSGIIAQEMDVVVSHGSGYTDPNNDLASAVTVSNVLGGQLTQAFSCNTSTGVCTGRFIPSATSSSFNFTVTTRDNTRTPAVDKSSVTMATYSITSTQADSPPVAQGYSLTLPGRVAQEIVWKPGSGYTDADNDPATSINILNTQGLTVSGAIDCNITPADHCKVSVSAADGTESGLITYTVTANGATSSNTGVLVLSFDGGLQGAGCVSTLGWTGLPVLDKSCRINAPVTATFDGCSAFSASGGGYGLSGIPISATAPAPSQGALAAQLVNFPSAAGEGFDFGLYYQLVTDFGDEAQLHGAYRVVGVQNSLPNLSLVPVATSRPRAQGMEGTQVPEDVCTGSCQTNFSASQANLDDDAGASLAAGGSFTCAITDTSGTQCSGDNSFGQLTGLAGTAFDGTAVALTAGKNHACALLSDGTAACWGRNDEGQLGNGTFDHTSVSSVATRVKRSGTLNLSSLVAIAAGDDHTCAVSSSGLLWCWGKGDQFQLGPSGAAPNTNADSVYARLVKASAATGAANLSGVLSVSAGRSHTCAVVSVSASSRLRCFGESSQGQLGYGTGGAVAVSKADLRVSAIDSANDEISVEFTGHADVSGFIETGDLLVSGGSSFYVTVIAAGAGSAVVKLYSDSGRTALVDADSFLVNDILQSQLTLVAANHGLANDWMVTIDGVTYTPQSQPAYAARVLSTNVLRVTNSPGQSQGVVPAGTWVSPALRRLGLNPDTDALRAATPSPVAAAVAAVSAGGNQTCLITSGAESGRVYCSPADSSGVFVGIESAASTPLEGAVGIASGASHSCALDSFGDVSCWGSNTSGQVDPESVAASFTLATAWRPELDSVTPSASTRGLALSAGDGHTCVTVSPADSWIGAPQVWCWGDDALGQIGTDTVSSLKAQYNYRIFEDESPTAKRVKQCGVRFEIVSQQGFVP